MSSLLQIEDLRTEIRLRGRPPCTRWTGVSLSLEAGECLGIVGESGCGKTMTALSIMQLLPPGGHIVGGTITLDGQEISSLNDDGMRHVRGNEVGMIFQDPMTSLNPTMTVGDQIAETVLLHRGADAQDRAGPGRRGAGPGRHAPPGRAGVATTRTSCPAACGSA